MAFSTRSPVRLAVIAWPYLRRLLTNCHWGTDWSILEKANCHIFWQADTTMRRWIARQTTGVHPNSPMDSEKIWHGGAPENRTVGWKIFCNVHVLPYDLASSIDVIAVSARNVRQVFLGNSEFTQGRVEASGPVETGEMPTILSPL